MPSRFTIVIFLASTLALLPACAKKDVKDDAGVSGLSASSGNVAAPAPSPDETNDLKKIYFDTDKSNLRADAKRDLLDDVKWLKANAKAKVTVEGHCDERGSDGYNDKLGEQRAQTVKRFLTAHGIKRQRVHTISKGKTQPVDPGHDESAWRQNRRASFRLAS